MITKLWLTTVWVFLVASVIGLAAACSGSEAPAAFQPPGSSGNSSSGSNEKDGGSRANPPPRPIDETPDPVKPDDAPAPKLTSTEPSRAVLNGLGPTIIVRGALFVPRSKVLLDGTPIATSYESETELKATIPDDKLKAVAALKVTVKTDPPGGGTSASVDFNIENPKPELTQLAPLSVKTQSGTTVLTLTGKGFVPGAKVRFGDSDLGTTFKSDTEITATIPSGLLGVSKSILVRVTNPAPGGGASGDLAFTISDPQSSITSITPTTANATAASVVLTVKGTGFVGTPVVVFKGTDVPTQQDASDQLKATVPGTLLTDVAEVSVAVRTGGGVSAPVPFNIVYPKPTVTKVEPNEAGAGANPTLVTITGTKFFPGSIVTFGGTPSATTFVSATQVTATLTAAQLADAGTIDVKVVNPTPGGGPNDESRVVTVKNAVPKVNAFAPAAVDAIPSGVGEKDVTALGVNIVKTTTARGRVGAAGAFTPIPATYVDSSHLALKVPASLLKDPGTEVIIQLINPAPGGGTSTGGPRLQVLCNSTGVNVHLDQIATQPLTLDLPAAPKVSRWEANGGTCPGSFADPVVQQPVRYAVVQNSTTADIVLTAWADCPDGKEDAFLAFYKRDTAPNTDDERKACTGTISHGQQPFRSPDANGSATCPGLLKGNGGLRLAACERAIIQVQSFDIDDADTPAPLQIKVKGEAP